MNNTSRISMKKFLLLYSIPFLLSVLLILITDPLAAIDIFYQTIFLSIFTFGLPIGIALLPYCIYFYVLQRYLKTSFLKSVTALISTMIGIIIVILFIQNTYKTFEKRFIFTNETTNVLSERSIKLFEKETGIEGKVNKVKMHSRYTNEDGGNFTVIQERSYDIEVVTKSKTDLQKIPRIYEYISRDGKWILEAQELSE